MKKISIVSYLILIYGCSPVPVKPTNLTQSPLSLSSTQLQSPVFFIEIIAKNTEQGLVFTLTDDFFIPNKADLSFNALKNLDLIADKLSKQYRNHRILIEGHTDNEGNALYNLGLSRRRASTVRFALIERQIKSNRISSKGMGSQGSIASNQTRQGRKRNRRVEIIILNANRSPSVIR